MAWCSVLPCRRALPVFVAMPLWLNPSLIGYSMCSLSQPQSPVREVRLLKPAIIHTHTQTLQQMRLASLCCVSSLLPAHSRHASRRTGEAPGSSLGALPPWSPVLGSAGSAGSGPQSLGRADSASLCCSQNTVSSSHRP